MRRHLDSEYKDRWEQFFLANGIVEDSRNKNWRDVQWSQVVRIEATLLGGKHVVDCTGLGFRAFMNFRWGGTEPLFDSNGKFTTRRPIRIWTIGWTDGTTCFLKDICFYTGKLIKEYTAPLSQFANHLHPLVKDKVLG